MQREPAWRSELGSSTLPRGARHLTAGARRRGASNVASSDPVEGRRGGDRGAQDRDCRRRHPRHRGAYRESGASSGTWFGRRRDPSRPRGRDGHVSFKFIPQPEPVRRHVSRWSSLRRHSRADRRCMHGGGDVLGSGCAEQRRPRVDDVAIDVLPVAGMLDDRRDRNQYGTSHRVVWVQQHGRGELEVEATERRELRARVRARAVGHAALDLNASPRRCGHLVAALRAGGEGSSERLADKVLGLVTGWRVLRTHDVPALQLSEDRAVRGEQLGQGRGLDVFDHGYLPTLAATPALSLTQMTAPGGCR